MNREGVGSHLTLLEEIFKLKKINTVLEFGCGDYSTDFFVNNCEHVTSVEMQNQGWFDKISEKNKDNPKWRGILALGPREFEKLKFEKIDLCFVDGHGDSRPEQINRIQPHTDIIVAHDTETYTYHWERIMFFKTMYKFEYKKTNPYTTIWATDKEFIEELSRILK